MTVRLSARLAWHDNGWNGRPCKNPGTNTYCVGQYSFPGEMIAERRRLISEGSCEDYQNPGMLPCIYSINAFGTKELVSYAPPPDWFRDGTEVKIWPLPHSTMCTWPYEEMYKDEVLNDSPPPRYDPVKRREAVNYYFAQITPDHSLIFYYANYSNPFSENDQHRYVVVGISRVKEVGEELTWVNQSQEMESRYGPNVWLRSIVSHYPDQGFRIPYELYIPRFPPQ